MRCLMLLLCCGVLLAVAEGQIRFRVIREWKHINFTWPDEESYQTAVATGLYIPENNIVAGVKYYDDSYYITLPRMKGGVPATLTRIPAGMTKNTAPALQPFPSWEMNNVGDCNALQNVQNVEIDTRGQLWIIDGGRVETLSNNPVVKCPPKLVIFNIKMNQTTTTYTFPEEVASFNGSFLYDIVVDSTSGGYAYITDNSGKEPGIIVYSVKENRSWKLRHTPSMRADPNESHFRVGPIQVAAPINIASIALGPKVHTSNDHVVVNDDREVFYCPLSSRHLYSINTTVLRNEAQSMKNGEYQGEVKDYGLKASQTVGMIMDNLGNLYYSLLSSSGIAKWDSHTSFQSEQKLIAKDETHLEWPNSFTFDQNGNLTVLVNRLNRFIYGKLDVNEANFRMITANVNGKSYLDDDNFNYKTDDSAQDRVDNDPGIYNINNPVGTDQDPYLAPKPEPEPVPDHQMHHDLTDEDRMQSDQVDVHVHAGLEISSTQSPKSVGSRFFASTAAGLLLVVVIGLL